MQNINDKYYIYSEQGHTIKVPYFIIEKHQDYSGSKLDDLDLQNFMYISAGDTDLTDLNMSDDELSCRVLFFMSREIEDFKNGII